jgi:exonuclease SbcD
VKFLHTSDWHVGRALPGQSREAEHARALDKVLKHAVENKVDAVLIAGDVFDSSAPSPESEALVYNFFRELHGAGIPASVVAGNHDHPKRWDAVAPLLGTARIHVVGRPKTNAAMLEIASRDGKESAQVIQIPWIGERESVDFETLRQETADPLRQHAARVGQFFEVMCNHFDPSMVNVLMTHVFVDGAKVGIGGGERDLHIATNIYGVPAASLPSSAQYIAMGHVHRPQNIECGTTAAYSGSLLQLDFGEHDQSKYVNLIELHPRQPATVTFLPIKAGRQMVDIGSPEKGVLLSDLAAYAEQNETSWFRVYVDLDIPVPNLPQLVRGTLSSAVRIERVNAGAETAGPSAHERANLQPAELFSRFYASKSGKGREADDAIISLFNSLLAEEQATEEDGVA